MEFDAASIIIAFACADLPGDHARPHCRQCTYDRGYLARYVHANGSVALRWVCDWCEDFKTGGDLPHALLGDTPIERIPLRHDNTLDSTSYCAVCDNPAVEYHPWAPVALFPDWGHVDGVYLCRAHHDEWHRIMRAHGLRWPGELEAA